MLAKLQAIPPSVAFQGTGYQVWLPDWWAAVVECGSIQLSCQCTQALGRQLNRLATV